MKVKVGQDLYTVHWETRKFNQPYREVARELTSTTCILRKLDEETDEYVEITRYTVRQHSTSPSDNVLARKFAFTGVVNGFTQKVVRSIFWGEFKHSCRLTKRTLRVKNRELINKNCALEAEVTKLQGIVKERKVITV